MLVSSAAEIALSLQPSPASDTSAFRRMRALVSNCAGLLPARTSASSCSRSPALNFTTYFLTAISFPATNQIRRCLTATEIQKNTPHSRTRATRLLSIQSPPAFCWTEARMAGREVAVKKYVVWLRAEERESPEDLRSKGTIPPRRLLKVQILLKADVSEAGEGRSGPAKRDHIWRRLRAR